MICHVSEEELVRQLIVDYLVPHARVAASNKVLVGILHAVQELLRFLGCYDDDKETAPATVHGGRRVHSQIPPSEVVRNIGKRDERGGGCKGEKKRDMVETIPSPATKELHARERFELGVHLFQG